jgi:hypothetical protein
MGDETAGALTLGAVWQVHIAADGFGFKAFAYNIFQ